MSHKIKSKPSTGGDGNGSTEENYPYSSQLTPAYPSHSSYTFSNIASIFIQLAFAS